MTRRAIESNRGQTTTDYRTIRPFIIPDIRASTERRFNVQYYHDAKTNGTDYTAAFRAAFVAAGAVNGVVYVPGGTHIIRPYDRDDGTESLLILDVPDGVGIVGDGHESVIRFKVDTYAITDAHYIGLRLNGNNVIDGIRLDGNKGNISLSGDKIFYGIAAAVDSSNILIRNAEIHDIPASGATKESFGFTTLAGCHHIWLENVQAYDNNGSGISLYSDTPAPDVEGDNGGGVMVAANCRADDNTWQGITVYGTQDIELRNCTANGNDKVNFNIEFSRRVHLSGCRSTAGAQQNLRVMGYSDEVRLSNCHFYASAGTFEVSIQRGGYFRDIEIGAGETVTAVPKRVQFDNCRISTDLELGGGGSVHHMQIITGETGSGLTLLNTNSFSNIILNGPGVEYWRLSGWLFHEDEPTLRRIPPGVQYYNLRSVRPPGLNPLPTWTLEREALGTDTSQPYDGSDNQDPDAWTIIATTASAAYTSATSVIGGYTDDYPRLYHIRVRAKVTQPTGATAADPDVWVVGLSREHGYGGPAAQVRFGSIADSGVWVEGEAVAHCGPGLFQATIFYATRSATASGNSRIDIDWITVTEIASRANQNAADQLIERRNMTLADLPDYGTWHKGDTIHHPPHASITGRSGWMCTAGGTYGTLSAVTADTTDGDHIITPSGLGTLVVGQYITIAGVERASGGGDVFKIIYIDASDFIYLDDEADATVSDGAVAYSPPEWNKIFPVANDEGFVADVIIGSDEGIDIPRDEGGRRTVRFKIVNGFLRPYIEVQ